MAGEIPNLNVEVLVQLTNLTSAVEQATMGMNKIGNAAQGLEPKMTSAGSVMKGAFASGVLLMGMQQLTHGIEDIIKETSKAETTTVALATAMNNAKTNTEENRVVVEKSVTSMENLGFKGNDARESLTKLVTATGSVEKSTSLMSLAADLARAKHETLAEAAGTLSKATVGSAKAFKEFGITLDTHLPKTQAIAKAMDELNSKIGGQAQAYLKTYAGQYELLQTKMEAAKEQIGSALIPILEKLMGIFTVIFNKIQPILPELTLLATAIGLVVLAVKAWEYAQKLLDIVLDANPVMLTVAAVIALISVFVIAWNHSKAFREIIVETMETGVKAVGSLIHIFGMLVTGIMTIVMGPLKLLLKGLSLLGVSAAGDALKGIQNGIKGVGDFFDNAQKKVNSFADNLESLKNKKISIGISMPDLSKGGKSTGLDLSGDGTGGDGAGGGGSVKETAAEKHAKAVAAKVAKELEKRNALIKKLNEDAVKIEASMNAVLVDRQAKMDEAQANMESARETAYSDHWDKVKEINEKHADSIQTATDNYNEAIETATKDHEERVIDIKKQYADQAADINKKYADEAIKIQQEYEDKGMALMQAAADKQKSIIQKSIDVMTSVWQGATKIDLATLFKSGSGTASGLVDSLKTQLADVLKLQKDAGLLAAQGYNQSFIDQVISQGPTQGDALAQSILTATPDTQASIMTLYNQIEQVSQTGMNGLAAQMNDGAHFATDAMLQEYNSVPAELAISLAENGRLLQQSLAENANNLQTSLADNSSKLLEALDQAQKVFDKAQETATKSRDKAVKAANDALTAELAKADKTLADALEKSQTDYDKAVKNISDATMKALDKLQDKLDATAAKLATLGASTAAITGFESNFVVPTVVAESALTPSATDQAIINLYQTNNVSGYNMSDPNATATAIRYATPIVIPASPAPVGNSNATPPRMFAIR